jgi:hypothetical protein
MILCPKRLRNSAHYHALPYAEWPLGCSLDRGTPLILQYIENHLPGIRCAILMPMVQRIIVAVLCLGLLASGSGSIFSCDLFAAQTGLCERGSVSPDCVCPESSSQPAKLVSSADTACCTITQAPPPESSINFTASASGTALLETEFHLAPLRAAEHVRSASPRITSPPGLQQLLCVFLI